MSTKHRCSFCGLEYPVDSGNGICPGCGKNVVTKRIKVKRKSLGNTSTPKLVMQEVPCTQTSENNPESTESQYRIKLLKSEHRKIINLRKGTLDKLIPTIKQVLYELPDGKYWVFFKIGKLEEFEAFRLAYAKYADFDGKERIGHCISICNEKGRKLTNCLVLLVDKDDGRIKYLEYDKVLEVAKMGFLPLLCIGIAILYCCIFATGLFMGAIEAEYLPLLFAGAYMPLVARFFPPKLGKKINEPEQNT